MNRFLKVLMLSVFAVLFCIGNAGAITFTDTTTFSASGAVGYRLDSWDVISWTHHFDFDTTAVEVSSATLTLALRDDDDPWLPEYAGGWAEDGTWGLGEVDTDTYSFDIDASFLGDG